MRKITTFLLSAAALGASAFAFGQVTINIAGPTDHFDGPGDSSNIIINNAATTATTFRLSAIPTLSTGTVQVLIDGSFGSEAQFRLRNSAFPADFADLRVFNFGISFTSGVVVNNLNTAPVMTGPLVGKTIPAGSTWSVEAFDVFDDGADAADGVSSNVSFTLNVANTTPPAHTDLGTLVSGQTVNTSNHAAGQVRWYKFTLSQPITTANLRFLDIDTETTTAFADTEIGLFDDDGDLIMSDDDDGSGNLSQATFGPGAASRPPFTGAQAYNGRDGELAAGVYYIAVGGYNMTFAGGFSAPSTSTVVGDINLRINVGAGSTPQPPAAEDLGTLQQGLTTDTENLAAAGVKWYKFTTTTATSSSFFFDIDTVGTTAFGNNDTEIAIFSNAGALIATDDDTCDVLLSQLSFGVGAPERAAYGDGEPFAGDNGDLPAGTYYLAVTGFNGVFGNGWSASNDDTDSGPVVINLRYNGGHGGGPGGDFTGTITLQDTDADVSDETVVMEIVDPILGTLQTLNVTLNADGTFATSTTAPDGTYTVFVKGDTFLRKGVAGVTILGGAGVVNTSLLNGDVNNDNEVGPADFALFAPAFGSFDGDPNYLNAADLNDDGEVGPADFSILAANFGEFGD